MKTIAILVLTVCATFTVQAKVNDFNSLIEENSKAQKELHTDLKQNLNDTQAAVKAEKQDYIVEAADTINSPTKKSFTAYKKAKTDYGPASKIEQKRLALEIESAN